MEGEGEGEKTRKEVLRKLLYLCLVTLFFFFPDEGESSDVKMVGRRET